MRIEEKYIIKCTLIDSSYRVGKKVLRIEEGGVL
jgi:hypothetical protein